jgi:2-methylcitrate dehydratase PrpD
VTSDAVLALAARVSVREDPAMTAQLPALRPAKVTVRLEDGRQLTARTDTNRGDWADPYPREEIRAKYLSLTGRLWSEDAAAAVWDKIMALDARPGIAGLSGLMAQAPA